MTIGQLSVDNLSLSMLRVPTRYLRVSSWESLLGMNCLREGFPISHVSAYFHTLMVGHYPAIQLLTTSMLDKLLMITIILFKYFNF